MISALLESTRYGVPFETHFITKYYKRLGSYLPLDRWGNFTRLLRHILDERPVMQMKLNVQPKSLYEESQGDYAKLVNALCKMQDKEGRFESWGDKTPHYILDVDVLNALFPTSKYIFITRDGRDVALSLMAKPWGQNNVYSCAEYWKKCNEESDARVRLRSLGVAHEVRYEDLIERPEVELRNIYRFLGAEFHEEAMGKLLSRVRRDNRNHWKRVMSARDVEIFERIAGNTLRRFGYETTHPEEGVEIVSKIKYRLHENVHRTIHLAKSNTIDAIRIKFFGKEPFNE